jgi:hypothetical protein
MHGFKKREDPPSNMRGSQCSYEEKGAVSRNRKKRKTQTWQGHLACRFETKGDPLTFASERGPLCACEKRRTVREGEKKKTSPFDMCCFEIAAVAGGRRVGQCGQCGPTRQSHK